MTTRSPDTEAVSTAAVEAVELAFADTDHTRVPSWLLARIAVDAALPAVAAAYEALIESMRSEMEILSSQVQANAAADRSLRLVR